MPKQNTLGKKERLKSLKLIEELFEKGEKFNQGFYRVHYIIKEKERESLQFGVGVSSRHFKKAVDRNRIKRLTREAWRLQKKHLQESLAEQNKLMFLFVIYTGKNIPLFDEVKMVMDKLIVKLLSKLKTD